MKTLSRGRGGRISLWIYKKGSGGRINFFQNFIFSPHTLWSIRHMIKFLVPQFFHPLLPVPSNLFRSSRLNPPSFPFIQSLTLLALTVSYLHYFSRHFIRSTHHRIQPLITLRLYPYHFFNMSISTFGNLNGLSNITNLFVLHST